ncbi:MAG: isochorismatase family protein [Deltaproteobacteria bacterium]|nr:isochorismatase family protein [Deltaproteobacteria bacterium]
MTGMNLSPERSALAIIDIQERLVAAMPEAERERCVKNAAILAEAAGLLGVPVLVSEQYPKGLLHTVAPIAEKLPEGTQVIEKVEFDACANGDFAAKLDALGRDQVILTGMEAHICVFQTARGLVETGRTVHVAYDATCSRLVEHRDAARELWAKVGAVPTITETVLFDWLGKAGGDAFKTISKLIR